MAIVSCFVALNLGFMERRKGDFLALSGSAGFVSRLCGDLWSFLEITPIHRFVMRDRTNLSRCCS
jgi:hypothetical protein